MVGRVTMEKDFTEGKSPELVKSAKPVPRKPFVGNPMAKSFAIAVDAKGKLGWETNEIDGDHIIEILSESVSDGYLQYLQNLNISYIFAGKETLDFSLALEQLHDVFKIETLMLEGGGNINGSLLAAGLIDEISLLVLPLADGTINTPTTFEIAGNLQQQGAKQLKLLDVQKLRYDVIWLRYRVTA
jgi:riboflavin biosynthesis pyrimidine reductase